MLLAHVPVAQPCQAGVGQLLHALLRIRPGLFQGLHALHGNRVFTLRGQQFGGIDLKQGLAFGHGLTGGVDMQLFHIALKLGRYGVAAPLVGLDPAGGAHHFVQHTQGGRLGAYAHLLNFFGAELQLIGRRWLAFFFLFVHRDVVHAHGILLGCGRGVCQPHGVAVETDFSHFLNGDSGRHLRFSGRASGYGGGSGMARTPPVACKTGGSGHHHNANGQRQVLAHKSSPNRRSICARRAWPSAWALMRDCLAWRIWRWASSTVAKSSLPVS